MLRDYAAAHGVALAMVGKLIVATDADEERGLAALLDKGRANGVAGLEAISPPRPTPSNRRCRARRRCCPATPASSTPMP